MKRLERLTSLVSLLQSKRFTRIQDITNRFDISERTAYRDLRSLDEAGIPISYEKDKGYFVLDTFFLPPLSFTIDEAKSFIFADQLAKKYIDKNLYKHFESAFEKIRNKLKNYQLESLEYLDSNVKSYVDSDYINKYLQIAEQACSNKHVLSMMYVDTLGNETIRTIEPIGITFYSQSWHLIAYCRLRQDYRDFVLNRIHKINPTGEKIIEKRLNLNEYIKKLQMSEAD